MSDEHFLIVSYVLGGLASLGLAVAAYAWLRRPFAQIMQTLPNREHARTLQRSFPMGTILFALAGFFSVTYMAGGCDKSTYAEVIADHAYMVAKNQEQIAKVCDSLAIAVFFWGIVVLLTLLVIRRAR